MMSDKTTRVSLKRKRGVANNITATANALPARKIVKIVSVFPNRSQTVSGSSSAKSPLANPEEVLASILSKNGIHSPQYYSNDELKQEGFFVRPSEKEIRAWSMDIVTAVRNCDLDTLQEFHRSGRSLKCSNRFGESLLHLACRKGFAFLINQAKVPVQVADDMGRTPLHDAFWAPTPNFDIVDLLIRKCPDLLFVKDQRGHTALNYSRQEHWDDWADYLRSRSDIISSHSQWNGSTKLK